MPKSFRAEIDEILNRWGYGSSGLLRRLKMAGPDGPDLNADAMSAWNMLDMASKAARAVGADGLEGTLIRLSGDFNRIAMAGGLYTEESRKDAMMALTDALGDTLRDSEVARELLNGLNWEDINNRARNR